MQRTRQLCASCTSSTPASAAHPMRHADKFAAAACITHFPILPNRVRDLYYSVSATLKRSPDPWRSALHPKPSPMLHHQNASAVFAVEGRPLTCTPGCAFIGAQHPQAPANINIPNLSRRRIDASSHAWPRPRPHPPGGAPSSPMMMTSAHRGCHPPSGSGSLC
eukprot:SAG31_NODE_1086_length_9998_cov_2.389837_3_plen_164_part_00